MWDIETLGRRAGCAIISIGAVEFCPLTGRMGREFYVPVYAKSCIDLGLHVDPETEAWWKKQSDEAKLAYKAAHRKGSSKPLMIALEMFSGWLAPIGKRSVKMWGCGADFDNAIGYACYAACDLPVPWEFWNSRCYRTLKNLYPTVKVDRAGVYHNALDDAKTQAYHALAIFEHMRATHKEAA